jgi:hypothetical protein
LEKTFYAVDSLKIKQKFGEPSKRISEKEWRYCTSKFYGDNKYDCDGITLVFKDGKLEKFTFYYSIPNIEKDVCGAGVKEGD